VRLAEPIRHIYLISFLSKATLKHVQKIKKVYLLVYLFKMNFLQYFIITSLTTFPIIYIVRLFNAV